MKRTTTAIACSAAALALGLSGCGASFEGSGSKDAASAEQLALRTDDPWAAEVAVDGAARAEGAYADGVYVGRGRGMEGAITVTLLLDDGRITCLETTQEGESQSRGGYEAIRDGLYAEMIEAAQGADIDAVAGATITTAGVKQAVADALRSGKLLAAGMDVVSAEPIRADNPLLTAPNCFLTPHIAWAPLETRRRLQAISAENLRAFQIGRASCRERV